MELNRVGTGPHDDRGWYVASSPSLRALTTSLTPPSPHFVLFLAIDSRSAESAELLKDATALIRSGACNVCCWGPGAERLERCFDEAAELIEVATPLNGPSDVVMTVSDEDEPLEEAVWFAAWSAYPTARYVESTKALIAVAVGAPEWSERVASYLSAGAPMLDEV